MILLHLYPGNRLQKTHPRIHASSSLIQSLNNAAGLLRIKSTMQNDFLYALMMIVISHQRGSFVIRTILLFLWVIALVLRL